MTLHNLCWSCQHEITSDESVRLGPEVFIPCCIPCWGHLSVAERLTIAQQYWALNATRPAAQAIRTMIERLLEEAERQGLKFGEEGGGFEWLRRN